VLATSPSGSALDLDLAMLGCRTTVVRGADAREHVVLHDGGSHLRFDVRSGSVLAGPVALQIVFERLDRADQGWAALRRLRETIGMGRLAARPALRGAAACRAIAALRCWDARRAGASHRDLAELLVGPERTRAEWRGASDHLRSRVRRSVRFAEAMIFGGWRALLAPVEPAAGGAATMSPVAEPIPTRNRRIDRLIG